MTSPENAALAIVEPDAAPLVAAGGAWRPPERDPAIVYLASLAGDGRRVQRAALEAVAALFGQPLEGFRWERLTYAHTTGIRTRLLERGLAPATINRYLCALRGALLEARRLGLMSAEDCASASDIRPVKGERLPAGRALTRREVTRLFKAAAADPLAGRRDAALLAVAFGSGLRRAELVALDLASWSPTDGALRVIGKGNKERLAYVAAGRAALDAWLEARGAEPGPLFLPITARGVLEHRRLTDDAVLKIFRRLARRARVARFSPHDLRRTFISTLLDAGADLATVQQLAGHADVSTTARYDRRGEAARKKAAGLIKM